jgi:hypothetical protein
MLLVVMAAVAGWCLILAGAALMTGNSYSVKLERDPE